MVRRSTEVNSPDGQGAGATAHTTISVRGRDGSLFGATVYRCVNATTDPDLRDELLSGDLYEVEDPTTGDIYRLALDVRYHDPAREIFALVIPEQLRHRELELRRELLGELAAADGELPDYMRAFETVVGPEGLRHLEEKTLAAASSDGEGDAAEATRVDPQPDQVEEERAELEEERERLQAERDALERDRDTLERARERVRRERDSLEEERARIEAERLNLEQERRRLESGEKPASDESTQVVTDSQFIEVVDQDDLESGPVDVSDVQTRGINVAPEDFELRDARRVTEHGERIIAAAAVSSEVLDELQEADELTFFVQLNDDHGYPLVGLLLAALDEEQQEVASVGWALDIAGEEDGALLDALEEDLAFRVVLYDRGGDVNAVFDVDAPLEANLSWIRQTAATRLEELGDGADAFEDAARRWRKGATGRLETMRHNFASNRFDQVNGLSDLALAVGVVGFWSTPERFAYLVAHRSYPVDQFESLRERVIRGAIEHGLHLNKPLRELAVDMGIASDEKDLVEQLITEFTEVTVGLRDNDLDPLGEWENWEALVNAAERLGVQVDPDVLELAEASLNRARRFEESAPTQPA
ncbi:MAG: CpXC domain-containing protein [Persicimonas sp.]